MADLLQRSIGPAIQIEAAFPIRIPPARADANQLELALVNLAVNARDAMPDGGTITVSAKQKSVVDPETDLEPGDYICLTLADTGCGMDAKTLAAARDPFFTTKEVGKGTGLGLSMVHGFAAQSGGRFVLKSTVGAGTTAEIWLPIADIAEEARSPVLETSSDIPSTQRLKVLAVDDDALVLLDTTTMLEDLGHEVVEANCGTEALEILDMHQVDLVVTDQAMPNMTGLELRAQIRRRFPHLPVILTTGYADLTTSAGQDIHVLSKPFAEYGLAEAIEKAIERPHANNIAIFEKERLRRDAI
ncbi:PAS/PAC Sensor Hybrid Histidine Kinase [Fulvimarina pelagi HTCC2506]|uniref:histidine kinase n=1 Tax=Fulvimarina pelagi HTCC2506 TaxID=314231 RepID=Q0FXG7_9HYPH|nr:response regulator [Fulvimarina pelagi]EAU39683.1 PAS/PAC Sensor Hybrid Histidine Kinase [Fulvimarina pelagi HTCC2506]